MLIELVRNKQAAIQSGVSLFPFMSILICIIGILTLLISLSVVSKQQKENLSEKERANAEENRSLQHKMKEITAQLSQIETSLLGQDQFTQDLAKIRENTARLNQELKLLGNGGNETDTNLNLNQIIAETNQLKSEKLSIENKSAELKLAVAERLNQANSKGSSIINIGGTGKDVPTHIYFVECDSIGIIIHKNDGQAIRVLRKDIWENREYTEFCREIVKVNDEEIRKTEKGEKKAIRDAKRAGIAFTVPKTRKHTMVVYLIRKSNQRSYHDAAGFAQNEYKINIAKVPIPNDGPIDFSNLKSITR